MIREQFRNLLADMEMNDDEEVVRKGAALLGVEAGEIRGEKGMTTDESFRRAMG